MTAQPCGCEQRGPKLWICSYHQGREDERDEERAAVVAFMESHPYAQAMYGLRKAIERGDHRK